MAGEINKAVEWAISIANDDSHGYDQGGRWGPDYDCSSLVISAYQNAGVGVRTAGANSTHDMKPAFLKCGFADVTSSINLNTGAGLKKGDVLLNIKHHTSLVIEDGGRRVNAGSNENGGITGGKSGDQTGNEITIKGYSNYPWDCVLRYTKDTGGGSSCTDFPRYNLSDSAIRDIATMITGEQGGEDVTACRQEASQLANLNEVTYGRRADEASILKSLHDGWYSENSWSRGCTQTATDAVKFVLVEGKRVLPRYVTEHDTFPMDIKNAKSRNDYVQGQTTVRNVYGSEYVFYCFFGNESDKDIAGYFKKDYEKYKGDIAWTGSNVSGSSKDTKITQSTVVSESGGRGGARPNPMIGRNTLGGDIELYIINYDGKIMFPAVPGTVSLETYRRGTPGKLTFSVLKTNELDFSRGAQVILKSHGIGVFYGFVFEKINGTGSEIKVTAYDQLRYFKNKDCYVYRNKTAAELIKMIADDHNLVCGEMPDTGYKIPLRVEDNATLFDIVQNAFDLTLYNTGDMYVLIDDFGRLSIKKPKDWIYDVVIDRETAESFEYTTSINDDVYTRIKLYYDNDDTGTREIYIQNNEEKINRWGVLQMCESIEEGENGAQKAALLSKLYGQESKTLNVSNAFGSPEIKGGCAVCVMLDVGERVIQNFMLVESVKHKFSEGKHTMDLTLLGGDIQSEQ